MAPSPAPNPGSTGDPASEASASPWAVRYAEQPETPFEPAPDGRIRVELLTDPWSIWCWGFEPIARTLRLRFPSIEFRPLVGGMFPELPDPEERGFSIDRFFSMVQRTTGMPITSRGMTDDRPTSTYPACEFVHAVRLLDPQAEEAFLRGLREAAYLDARNISRPEVAAEVAEELGIGSGAFLEALETGEPRREFEHRLASIERFDMHAYPTLVFTVGDRQARVEGFQTLPSVLSITESISDRLHPSVPPPEIQEIVPPGERVATREVAEVFGVSLEQAVDKLEGHRREGLLERHRHPTGDVWTQAE